MPNEMIIDNLHNVQEAIELIEQRFSKIQTPKNFVESSEGVVLLDSISMRLQVVGESIKKIEKLDQGFLESYPEVEWVKIMKLRDLVSHHYERVDNEIVFDICKNHIPVLKMMVSKMLNAQ